MVGSLFMPPGRGLVVKNWATLTADENMIVGKHFTKGRAGKKIDKIVIHHNAGDLSIKDCWDVWRTRQASAHYQVQGDGRIGQLVWDRDTAWHAGNLAVNQTSIGIEHANNNTRDWTISDETLENGAHLVAALCVYYKLGRPQWGKNVYPHQRFSATACPGAIAGAQKAKYMERAQYWYDQMTGTKPVKKPVVKPKPSTLVVDGIAGKNTVTALQRALGTKADGVISSQPAVNKPHLKGFTTVQYAQRPTGSTCIKALQKRLGVTVDGFIGKNTVKAWQKRLNVTVDGYFGAKSVKALQKKLNQGRVF